MPKLKTSIVKESKPVFLKPYKSPKTPKPKPFKWPTAKRTRSRARTRTTSSGSSGKFFFWIMAAFLLYVFLQ
jgi:hypothetical protein